jgi:hypothetical protein
MSRVRPIELPEGGVLWFDTNKNGVPLHEAVSDEYLELLSTVEDIDLDDLIDADINQGEAILRIRTALGQDFMPQSVIDRRDRLRRERQRQPVCRNPECGKKGDSTKHHFVNKWMLRELDQYASKWADRSENCIPLCIHCHRMIHSRNNGPHSIVDWLTDKEKDFVERALTALSEQHPKIVILIGRGDESVYESCLVKDWFLGRFQVSEDEDND